MKLDININDNSLFTICIICIMIVLCTITFSIWSYNVKAVEFFTLHNYEEIVEKGSSIAYWRKIK